LCCAVGAGGAADGAEGRERAEAEAAEKREPSAGERAGCKEARRVRGAWRQLGRVACGGSVNALASAASGSGSDPGRAGLVFVATTAPAIQV
jgi:hypothetical protein